MKTLLLTAVIATVIASAGRAQDDNFRGLQQAMPADVYERAGLRKLTSDERAALDEFLRGYVAGKQQDAAAVAAASAVEQAVKERKVQTPDVFESRIAGTFKGYGLRTLLPLENGQVWKPTNAEIVSYSPMQSPAVVIYRDVFGHKMFIEGASMVRVKRVKKRPS
jgi:hypothetical protein